MLLINLIIYYVSWFLTLDFAASQKPYLAAAVCFAFLIVQLALPYFYDRQLYYRQVFLAIYATVVGAVAETFYLNLSVTSFTPVGFLPYVPPLWMILLYPPFSITLSSSLQWMTKRVVYQVLMGLLAPICYVFGAKIGACELPLGVPIAYGVIGAGWVLVMIILSALSTRIKDAVTTAYKKNQDAEPLFMLYDGDCPLCRREVDVLKKKPCSVSYVDIADKNFEAFQSITYDQAMKEMVVVEEGKAPIMGVDAFYEVYARRGWFFLAILLKQPGFYWLFRTAYKFFARYRLKLTGRS